ncbi:biotin/lipoate A/B protein ligase family protein [Pseudomonadota bacterium]
METHEAAMNMALDEACMEAVREHSVLPTIRFYRWQPSAVSIGYFQSLEEEIALDKCAEAGVDFVRRRTGGGAVYHDYDGEITYSVIAPETSFPKGIIDSYHVICGWIIDSLATLGVKAEFKPINDIVMAKDAVGPEGELIAGKKISGNAQTRRGGLLLQHGTILCTVDVPKMFSLLRVGQEKIADKLIAAVEDRVTSLKHLKPNLTMDEVYHVLLEGFTANKKVENGEWTVSEMQRAQELLQSRYTSDEWNKMR